MPSILMNTEQASRTEYAGGLFAPAHMAAVMQEPFSQSIFVLKKLGKNSSEPVPSLFSKHTPACKRLSPAAGDKKGDPW